MDRPAEAEKLQFVGKKTIQMIERGLRKRASNPNNYAEPAVNYSAQRAAKKSQTLPLDPSDHEPFQELAGINTHLGLGPIAGPSETACAPLAGRSRLLAQLDPLPATLTPQPTSSTFLNHLDRAKGSSLPSLSSLTEDAPVPEEGSPEAALLIALYEEVRDRDSTNWAEVTLSANDLEIQGCLHVADEYMTSDIVWHTKGLDTLLRRRFFNADHVPVAYSFTVGGLKTAHQVAGKASIKLFDIPDYVKRHKIKVPEKEKLNIALARSKSIGPSHVAATGNKLRDVRSGPIPTLPALEPPVASTSTLAAAPASKSAPPAAKSKTTPDMPFEWFFVSRHGARTRSMDDAHAEFGQDNKLLYKIEFRAAQRSHSVAQAVQDISNSKSPLGAEGPCVVGWSYLANLNYTAPGFSDAVTEAAGRPPLKTTASAPAVVQTKRKRELPPTLSSALATEDDRAHAVQIDPPDHQVIPTAAYIGPKLREDELVVMRPHEYRVVLVLDHRERQTINKLSAMGSIDLDARALAVADAIWIAQRKIPTGTPELDELVLDVAIERKRLSDLIGSIQSRRYDDQKARMKTSGITRLLYLLEDDHNERMKANWEQQIWTVRSQLQILDGFLLLIAPNFTKMVNMHVRLTEAVKNMYRGQSIYGIRRAHTNRKNYLGQLTQLREGRPAEVVCPTFELFQELNDKQRTVKSEWAAMMFAQAQMSAEKVEAFIARWPTPVSFYEDIKTKRLSEEALARASEDEQPKKRKKKRTDTGEAFVMNEAGKEGSRGIKQKLSKDLWGIWTQRDY